MKLWRNWIAHLATNLECNIDKVLDTKGLSGDCFEKIAPKFPQEICGGSIFSNKFYKK